MKVAGFPREFSDLLLDSPGPKGAQQRRLDFSPWDGVLREFVAGIREILDDFIDRLAKAITDAIADQLAVRLYMNRDCAVALDEPPLTDRLLVLLVRSDSMDTSEPAPAPLPVDVEAGRRGRAWPRPACASRAACPLGFRRVPCPTRRSASTPRFCFATITQRMPRGRRHAADRNEPCPLAETGRYRGAALS